MRWIVPIVLALAGCATPPPTWVRVDGKPAAGVQFEADQTVCRGEMQKATLSRTVDGFFARAAISEVYDGCMAGKGYVDRTPKCRKDISDDRLGLLPCP